MAEPLGTGSRLGGYRIDAVIGSGGMGTVYRATDERLGRVVALKLIAPRLARDEAFRRRFERESRIAASIEHPNVVALYEAGEDDGVLYIAMQLVEGSDLRELLTAESWLEPQRAARLTAQVAAALDQAHSRGLVHRDVKPGNILLGDVGGREWAYLTDFGLTKPASAGAELTGSGEWMGSLDYVSPEQIQGAPLDARSDVYSLGCVLFEMLTGRIPFERDDQAAKLWAHVNEEPPTASEQAHDVSASLDPVIARAMAKSPEDRYPSAGDFARAVTAAVGGAAVEQPERSVARGEAAVGERDATRALRGEGPTQVLGRLRDRRPLAIGASAVLLVIVVALAALLLRGDGPSVAGETDVGGHPVGISFGEGSVWVTDPSTDTLTRIDPDSGDVSGPPIEVGHGPTGVRTGAGFVWVTNSAGDTVSRIDPDRDPARVAGEIPVGRRPAGIKVGERFVWVANLEDGTVSRIKPGRDRVYGRPIPVGTAPASVAIGSEGGPSVWVALSGGGRVVRLAADGHLVSKIDVGARPRGVAVGEGKVWVSNSLDGSVNQIDPLAPNGGAVEGDAIPVGERPAGVAVGEGYVWVANTGDATVSRIDPSSGEVVGDPIEVGLKPRGITVGGGSVWVANSADGTVTRIEP